MDLDNFKAVERSIWASGRGSTALFGGQFCPPHLRKTDVIARLGGDEFAWLFPKPTRKLPGVRSQNDR